MNRYYLEEKEVSLSELIASLEKLNDGCGEDDSTYSVMELEEIMTRANGDIEFYYSVYRFSIY